MVDFDLADCKSIGGYLHTHIVFCIFDCGDERLCIGSPFDGHGFRRSIGSYCFNSADVLKRRFDGGNR